MYAGWNGLSSYIRIILVGAFTWPGWWRKRIATTADGTWRVCQFFQYGPHMFPWLPSRIPRLTCRTTHPKKMIDSFGGSLCFERHDIFHRDLMSSYVQIFLFWEGMSSCMNDMGYIIYEAKGLMKNSSCQRSFVVKVAPNHGKQYSQYSELPKAIPCNILKYN